MTYLATQVAAKRLIVAKGRSVTLTRHAESAYNTATGGVTTVDTATATTGVLLPLPRGLVHGAGSNISVGDQQLLLPGDIAAPAIADTVTIGGIGYTIIEVSPLNPGGTNLVYDCIVRGAG